MRCGQPHTVTAESTKSKEYNQMRILKTIIAAGLFTALTASAAIAQNGNVAVESAERDRYIIVFNDSVGNPRNVAAALARQHGFTVRQIYTTAL